jgi:hypothetical protein
MFKLCCVQTDDKVTDVGIIAVARNGAHTRLVLSFNINVTDAGICALGTHSSQLKSIFFDHCQQLTDASLTAVIKGCPLQKDISLLACRALTAATLVSIGARRHNLRKLCTGYTNLSPVGLDAVTWPCTIGRVGAA